MTRKNLTILIAFIFAICSCVEPKPNDSFLESNDLCLIFKDKIIHKYDPLTWQLGYNQTKKEFRVYNDNVSDFYILTCNQLPQKVGQEIQGDLKWSDSSIKNRKNLTFTVKKIDYQGRIWLWNSKNEIAISVMVL